MEKSTIIYINQLESYKTYAKSAHWQSNNMSLHRLYDDIIDALNKTQDEIAEIEQGVDGQFKTNIFKRTKKKDFEGIISFLNDLIKVSNSYYSKVKGRRYIGIKSIMENFLGELYKFKYLANLAIKDKIKENLSLKLKGRLLKEAVDDTFSYDELKSITTLSGRVKYCRQHLGMPIGNGSSRMVFQIDDNWCLKLAKNQKGLAQNEEEGKVLNDYYLNGLDIFPDVSDVSDDENWTFLVSQYVLPATKKDFEHYLGYTFEEFCSLLMRQAYNASLIRYMTMHCDEKLFKDSWENEKMTDWYDYIASYGIFNGDMCRIQNYGITTNGIVLLDHGLSDDIFKTYYSRR